LWRNSYIGHFHVKLERALNFKMARRPGYDVRGGVLTSANTQTPLYLKGPVFVTGGSGFIGTHLISALLATGVQVVNVDLRAPFLSEQASLWEKADLLDSALLKSLMSRYRPTIVYNLAAHARLEGLPNQMRVNVDGVRNLTNAISELGLDCLLVHASTQVVAGPSKGDFDPTAFDPQFGHYAESKVKSEKLLHALDPSFRWTIVRPSVIWGPYHPTFSRHVWRYIRLRHYLHPRNFDVIRSYGYVENVTHQMIRIAEVDVGIVHRKTFYVGDEPLPSTQWLDAFSVALTGRPVRRVPGWLIRAAAYGGEISGRMGGPSPINLGRLTRMTSNFAVPMKPTFAALGPSPTSLEEGVRRTMHWLKNA
jgi:nucleoside-diphosphate-sugar epimerase